MSAADRNGLAEAERSRGSLKGIPIRWWRHLVAANCITLCTRRWEPPRPPGVAVADGRGCRRRRWRAWPARDSKTPDQEPSGQRGRRKPTRFPSAKDRCRVMCVHGQHLQIQYVRGYVRFRRTVDLQLGKYIPTCQAMSVWHTRAD